MIQYSETFRFKIGSAAYWKCPASAGHDGCVLLPQPMRDRLAHHVWQRFIAPNVAIGTQRNPSGRTAAGGRRLRCRPQAPAEKCVKTWVTTPTLRCQRAMPFSTGGLLQCGLSSCAARQSEPGTSVMPPSRPFSGRVRTRSSSPRVTMIRGTPAQRSRFSSLLCVETFPDRHARAPDNPRERAQRAGRFLRRAD